MVAKPRTPASPPLEPPNADEQITSLLDEFGASDISLRLMRQSATPPKNWQYIATIPFASDLQDQVMQQFGGGNYKGLVYRGEEYVKGRTLTFSVAGRPKALDDETPPPNALAVLREEIRQLREQPRDSDGIARTVTMITGIVTAITPIVTKLLEKKGSGDGQSVTEVLNLMQNAEAKGEERGRELGKLLAGGGSDGIADVIKSNLPVALRLLEHRKQQGGNGAAPVHEPSPPPPVPSTPAIAEVLPPEYAWLPHVRDAYGMISMQADNGTDPELVAEFAFSQMSDDLEREITAATMRDDFKATMQHELADVHARHPEWLTAFVDAIVTQCKPDAPALPAKRGGKR